jgi:hypothetical protein
VILEQKPLLIPIISSGSRTAANNGYGFGIATDMLICSGLEIVTDGSFQPLQMTFSVVVVLEFLIISITILVRIFILRGVPAQLAKHAVGIETTSV